MDISKAKTEGITFDKIKQNKLDIATAQKEGLDALIKYYASDTQAEKDKHDKILREKYRKAKTLSDQNDGLKDIQDHYKATKMDIVKWLNDISHTATRP